MKLHVSMTVEDFDQAKKFYSTLFDLEPMVVRDGYAKWDVRDPAVNFVIEAGKVANPLDHIGIQAETEEELETVADRIRKSGQPFLDVAENHCCYAKMDKAWVKGMAGEKWEAFLTHSHDSDEYGEETAHLVDAL